MRIAFHSNQLGIRGTEVALFDYAYFNQIILGNESIIAYDATRPDNDARIVENFTRRFPVHAYRDFSQFETIVQQEKCDRAYFIKAGFKDGKLASGIANLVHAVFAVPPHEQHGTIFAFVSEWLASFASSGAAPFVPHMIHLPDHDRDLRTDLGIAKDALVVGSYGGDDCFNLPFVPLAILEALQKRKDLVFLFMNYPPFIRHERVIFLPGNPDRNFKVAFINTTNAMLHAQKLGESFGLACGEFSSRNKPIVTFGGGYGRSHIEILGAKALIYHNKQDLDRLLQGLDKQFIESQSWDCYSARFSPERVMSQFRDVFLTEGP